MEKEGEGESRDQKSKTLRIINVGILGFIQSLETSQVQVSDAMLED